MVHLRVTTQVMFPIGNADQLPTAGLGDRAGPGTLGGDDSSGGATLGGVVPHVQPARSRPDVLQVGDVTRVAPVHTTATASPSVSPRPLRLGQPIPLQRARGSPGSGSAWYSTIDVGAPH